MHVDVKDPEPVVVTVNVMKKPHLNNPTHVVYRLLFLPLHLLLRLHHRLHRLHRLHHLRLVTKEHLS